MAENPIDQERMAALLTEIHLVEGAIAPMLIQGDSAIQYIQNNYEYLFVKYKTNRSEFKASVQYYVQHPKQLDRMYEKIIENLNKMQSQIQN